MNPFDIAIFGVIFLSALVGIWRGATREILGIASWVLSILATWVCWGYVYAILHPLIGVDMVSIGVSCLVVFVISLTILGALTQVLSRQIKSSVIGGVDRILGMIYGFVRGGIIALFAGFIALKIIGKKDHPPAFLAGSKVVPWISFGLDNIRHIIPWDNLMKSGMDHGGSSDKEDLLTHMMTDHVVKSIKDAVEPTPSTKTQESQPRPPQNDVDRLSTLRPVNPQTDKPADGGESMESIYEKAGG